MERRGDDVGGETMEDPHHFDGCKCVSRGQQADGTKGKKASCGEALLRALAVGLTPVSSRQWGNWPVARGCKDTGAHICLLWAISLNLGQL